MARYFTLICVYLISGIIPLFTQVGQNFEYEYTLIAAWAALALIPSVALLCPDRMVGIHSGRFVRSKVIEFYWIFLFSPLTVPLIAGYAFYSETCKCSSNGYLFWMAVIWYPAWILAHAMHHLIVRWRLEGKSRVNLTLGYLSIITLVVLVLALEFWFNPQKRSLNLFAGFLHGPIYDTWISVDSGIVWGRAAHFFVGCLILLAAWFRRTRSHIIGIVAISTLWGLSSYISSKYDSSSLGKSRLDALMNQEIQTPDFTLHFRVRGKNNQKPSRIQVNETPKDNNTVTIIQEHPLKPKPNRLTNTPSQSLGDSVSTPISSASAPPKIRLKIQEEDQLKNVPISFKRIFRQAQFHVSELKKIFGQPTYPHIEIYVYPSQNLKKLWFGAGATDVTDIHTPSIHITLAGWNHPTLRHELVHALSSGFGFKGLGFHPNVAFTEGLAVALAPIERSISLDDGAAAILETKKITNIQNLFSPYFWRESGVRAYTVAGSLIKFLIETYGFSGVKANYSGKSWEESFGKSKSEITAAWRLKILKGFDKKKFEIYSEALYRHPGVLRSICPHSKADLRRLRENKPYVRIRQPLGWNPDKNYWNWRQSLDPSNISNRLVSWRKKIKEAVLARSKGGSRLETWQLAIHQARNTPPKVLEDIEIAILESDLLKLIGKTNESIDLLQTLVDFSTKNYLSDSLIREIHARLSVEQLNKSQSGILRSYLAGWSPKLPKGTVGHEPWIITYLRIRNRKKENLSLDEILELTKTIKTSIPKSLPKTFHLEWHRFLAFRLMDYEQYATAADSWLKSLAYAPRAKRAALEEHTRQARFYAKAGQLR